MFRPTSPVPEWFTADDSVFGVALVLPLHGPAGMFGPTCESCAQLAAEEVNRAGGVLGRELRLLPVDGGGPRVKSPTTSRRWWTWERSRA